jgi:plastocyanin
VRIRTIVVALAAGGALCAPAAAQAATKTVDMGVPLASQKAFNNANSDVNDFVPHGTTIHVGDKIKFVATGFHTLDLPAKGKAPFPLIIPTANNVSGSNDAAGNPFWFNGRPILTFSPTLLKFAFGKKLTYSGKQHIESGLPVAPKPKPISVKFTKAGKYTFFCNIHAGMKGTVKVVSKRKAVPSKKKDKAALQKQLSRDLKAAQALAKNPVSGAQANNDVSVGASAAGGVEFFGFAPSSTNIPAGTTLRFHISSKSLDIHTATTGPGDPNADPNSYLGKLAATYQGAGPFDPIATYPSEQPGSPPATLTSTLHGNGFWSTGPLSNHVAALPKDGSVKFGQAGTYNFYCLIHPFMHLTVTVH